MATRTLLVLRLISTFRVPTAGSASVAEFAGDGEWRQEASRRLAVMMERQSVRWRAEDMMVET